MQIRRTAGLWKLFLVSLVFCISLPKIAWSAFKALSSTKPKQVWQVIQLYKEFYIPARNRLLLTLLSWMSTLRLPKSKSLALLQNQLKLFSSWLTLFPKTATIPSNCDNHLFRGFTGDKEVAIRLFLWVRQYPGKISKVFKALRAPCTSSESWLSSTFFGGILKDTLS